MGPALVFLRVPDPQETRRTSFGGIFDNLLLKSPEFLGCPDGAGRMEQNQELLACSEREAQSPSLYHIPGSNGLQR